MRPPRAKPSPSLIRTLAFEAAAQGAPGVTAELVLSVDRRAAVVWARARVCRRLWAMTTESGNRRFSLTGIAERLSLDHTTVMYALRRDLPEASPKLCRREPKWKRGRLPKVTWLVRSGKQTPMAPSQIAPPSTARLMGAKG